MPYSVLVTGDKTLIKTDIVRALMEPKNLGTGILDYLQIYIQLDFPGGTRGKETACQ